MPVPVIEVFTNQKLAYQLLMIMGHTLMLIYPDSKTVSYHKVT